MLITPALVLSVFAGAQPVATSQDAPAPKIQESHHIVRLEFAAASELVPVLIELAPKNIKIVSDQRTNSLLVAGTPKQLEQVTKLVAHLDRKVEGSSKSGGSQDGLFPQATHDLSLNADDAENPGIQLLDLCDAYAQVTSQRMILQDQDRQQLQQIRIQETGVLDVSAGELQGYLENVLAANGFAIMPLGGSSPHLFGVMTRFGGQRVQLRERAVNVGEDQVAWLSRHPAVMFTHVVRLETGSSNEINQAIFRQVTDAQSQMIAAMGNSIALTGFGPWVASMRASILVEDGMAAKKAAGARVIHHSLVLEFANAIEIVPLVTQALEASHRLRGTNTRQNPMTGQMFSVTTLIQADPRRNALLVTSLASDLEEIRDLVALLDVP